MRVAWMVAGAAFLAAATLTWGPDRLAGRAATDDAEEAAPRYTPDGALLRPEGYRQWVFVGASLGLSYAEHPLGQGPDVFHNVYLEPRAFAHYRRTGAFPEGTVLALELFRAARRESIARGGLFEGERVGLELAVKDAGRGWSYYGFGDGSLAEARPFARAACFECHRAHGGRDNVFTQFYPVLRDAGGGGS